jgi:hypothetical protein
VGQGAQISTLDFSRIVVPMETELGEMTVHLAVREMDQANVVNIGPLVASPKATSSGSKTQETDPSSTHHGSTK